MRWVYDREAKHLLKYESTIANKFNQGIIVSKSEKNLFQEQIPVDNIHVIGNGVDHDFFDPSYKSPLKKEGPALVFTGMMDYWPNIEGVTWFADEIFVKIQEKFPDITFYIVGNRPGPNVTRLAQRKGIVVTGFVEDIRDYIAIADICVIPLRIARGIQNKVLEAMSMGKATIVSTAAFQGITAENGKHLLVADTPSDFISAITRLINNNDLRGRIGSEARGLVVNQFNWGDTLKKIDALLYVY